MLNYAFGGEQGGHLLLHFAGFGGGHGGEVPAIGGVDDAARGVNDEAALVGHAVSGHFFEAAALCAHAGYEQEVARQDAAHVLEHAALCGSDYKHHVALVAPRRGLGHYFFKQVAAALGGADIPKAERGYRYSFTVTMILMVGIAAVLFVFADWMIIPFTYSESMVEYRPVFAHVLRIYALLIPFIGMIDIGSSILQSLRLAQVSMFSSFARNILIVVMLFFASSVSLDAIYWSLVVAEVIGGALMLWLAKVGLKHYRRGRERPGTA